MGILEYVLGHIFTCVDAHVLKWRGYKKFLSLSLSPSLKHCGGINSLGGNGEWGVRTYCDRWIIYIVMVEIERVPSCDDVYMYLDMLCVCVCVCE